MHYDALQTTCQVVVLCDFNYVAPNKYTISVKSDRLAHGCLDVQRLDVLPIFLQQRNEKINALINSQYPLIIQLLTALTQHDIGEYLVIGHLNVANSNAQAKDLLELEFDGGSYFRKLIGEIFSVRDGCGELPSYRREIKQSWHQNKKSKIPLERPGPKRRGICLIKASEARKASYFFASFFTSFLFLFSLYAW